jgi:hypothetical protein
LASGFSLVSSRLPLPPPPPPGLGFPMPRTLASSVGRRGGCWEGRSTGGASASGAPYRRQRAGRGGRPAVPQLRVLRTGVRGGSGGVRYCTASLLASPPIVAAAAAARFGVSNAQDPSQLRRAPWRLLGGEVDWRCLCFGFSVSASEGI